MESTMTRLAEMTRELMRDIDDYLAEQDKPIGCYALYAAWDRRTRSQS